MVHAKFQLRLVATLFFAWGVIFAILSVAPTRHGLTSQPVTGVTFRPSLFLLAIPIGLGLLAGRRIWRVFALIYLYASLAAACLSIALAVWPWGYIELWPFVGFSSLSIRAILAVFAVASAVLSVWALRVLRSTQVTMLFATPVQAGV